MTSANRARIALAALLALPLLGACSPRTYGVVGLALDDQGRVVAHAHPCRPDAGFDRAVIDVRAEPATPGGPYTSVDVVVWESPTSASGPVSWRVDEVPGPSWRDGHGQPAWQPSTTYRLAVSETGKKDQYSLARLSFTTDDLARLERGRVWLDRPQGGSMSVADFAAGKACAPES
ncbi:hypothetical protein ACSDQ9_08110 [Aestuariimicrobium soli]|uniref:hypothetical protein n=1 Tax=Aestuariimicrobium soli TaxID=2035834 RepID=UPI003EB98BA2